MAIAISGGFTSSDAVAVWGQVWYLGIGDVTEGNGEDVVVTNIAGAFSVLANQADGTLGEPQVTSDGLFPRSLALADFDIDGHLDAAVIDDQVDLVRVYPGRGDGAFKTAKAFVSQTTPVHLIHGDWDGDPYPTSPRSTWTRGTSRCSWARAPRRSRSRTRSRRCPR